MLSCGTKKRLHRAVRDECSDRTKPGLIPAGFSPGFGAEKEEVLAIFTFKAYNKKDDRSLQQTVPEPPKPSEWKMNCMTEPETNRIQDIQQKIKAIQLRVAGSAARAGRTPASVTLLAATKTRTCDEVRAAIDAGIDAVGENRVQELRDKLALHAYDGCPLHLIGPLQTNKVKYLIGHVAMIHSVDSIHLADCIQQLSSRADVQTDVLIEVNIGGEASKSGVTPTNAQRLAEHLLTLPAVRLRGLMTIPPVGEEPRRYFAAMRTQFEQMRQNLPTTFDTLSMGMSRDFETAIEEGATIVRVGSAIFGARPANPVRKAEEQA